MILEKRVAVITGATGALGEVISRELAAHGASLGLLDRNAEKLAALEKTLNLPNSRILVDSLDLLNPSETRSSAAGIAAKFGHIDILLHLVGGWTGGKTLLEATSEDIISCSTSMCGQASM